MKRPWQIWLLFSAALAVVFAVMGWVTANLLRLEQAGAEAQRQAAFEETVRLALWRMDAAASTLIIQESARPYYDYMAFNPARLVNPTTVKNTASDDLVPSPLLTQSPSNVMVYFNGAMDEGKARSLLTSPQVPTGDLQAWASTNLGIAPLLAGNSKNLQTLAAAISPEEIMQALGSRPPPITVAHLTLRPARMPPQPVPHQALTQQASPQPAPQPQPQAMDQDVQVANAPAAPPNAVAQADSQAGQVESQMAGQQVMNVNEFVARQNLQQRAQKQIKGSKDMLYNRDPGGKVSSSSKPQPQAAGQTQQPTPPQPAEVAAEKVNAQPASKPQAQAAEQPRDPPPPQPPEVAVEKVDEDIMRPVWIREFLVLARGVKASGKTYVQGAWINWPRLREDLLDEIRDLLPGAELVRPSPDDAQQTSRMMAALPVKLIPGPPAMVPPALPSPLALPLALAWCCLGLAALAVAVLLAGAVSLSERRGAFVSAVTHELRTPLTTFRMYSEMLAEGMVRDEAKRKNYLRTLCTEGNRLSHLVENVLSYARLERGRARRHVERLPLGRIVERVSERLAQHAERCGMVLAVEESGESPDAEVTIDLSAAEQILFNLMDNACKYAASAADRRIHLETRTGPGHAFIRVRDHGPGISREDARRLFKPFRKSAKHAAESAPGVGLGLALSRQLARQMGGDLAIDFSVTDGACLQLTLVSTTL